MARLNEDLAPGAGSRLSTLPAETAEDAVVCSLDWLKEAVKTPDGLDQAFQLIAATVRECEQLRENLQARTQAYNTQIEELIAERDQLNSELLQALRQQAMPRSPTPQPAPAAVKSAKIPDPPVFTGAEDDDIDNWLSKMRSKLTANADHYNTEALKKSYVENRVGGIASKHLAPRLRENAVNAYTTAAQMLETLERVYADPDRRFTSLMSFRKLYQGRQDFNTFWAEFQRLSAELDFSQETLIDELRNKVSAELERALITELNPDTVQELARKCQLYDQ